MRSILFSIVFFGIFGHTHAQMYSADAIPPALISNANAVIRTHEVTYNVYKVDEAEIDEWTVITILNKEGDSYARCIETEDDFEKLKSMKGSLFDAAGTLVRESKKQDVRDYTASDADDFINTRVKLLEMEYGSYPYTVEFRTKKTVKGFFRIPDFVVQRLGQSVVSSAFTLIATLDYSYKWKGLRTDVKPVITEAGGQKSSVWKFSNLPAIPDESNHPYFNDEYSSIVIAPSQVNIDGYSGSFSDWKQIGAFFYKLNEGRDVLSPEMQTIVTDLTKDKKTNREKIEALYKYLQQNHRYVSIQIGIGGWQTLDANFVEKKKYGDCKALSNYMHALLKAAGIESYVANIFAGDSYPAWYDDAPIPYANHVILYVPGEDLWVECTSNSAPLGYLGDFTAGRKALLLTPQGGKLVQTPVQTAADNTEIAHTVVRLDETGAAEIENSVQASCDRHDLYRYWTNQKKQPDIEKAFIEKAGFPIAELHKFQVNNSDSAPQSTVDFSLKINNFVSKSGKRMFVPVNKVNAFTLNLPANEKRVLDLKLTRAFTLKDTVEIQIPAGFALENMPPAKHLESEFGRYDFQTIKEDENKVRVLRTVEVLPVSVPAARYNEVRQFYQDMNKADGAQLVLVKKT